MAVTYEQLIGAGMSEAQARLLAGHEPRRDWTGHLMVVTLAGVFATALIGVLGWLAISVTNMQTSIALLQEGQTALQSDVTEILARLPD